MEKNQCTYCDGLGHCPGCDGLGHARRFGCSICGGSGDCPECEGYGISFKAEEELKEHQRGGLAHPHEFIKKKGKEKSRC